MKAYRPVTCNRRIVEKSNKNIFTEEGFIHAPSHDTFQYAVTLHGLLQLASKYKCYTKVWDVTIPDGVSIKTCEAGIARARTLHLSNLREMRSLKISVPQDEQLAIITENIKWIKHIRKPSEETMLAAIEQDPFNIKCIVDPPKCVQIAAVKKGSFHIKDIKNPCEEACLIAVAEFPSLIQHVPNPTPKLQNLAFSRDPSCIKYIYRPCSELAIKAAKKDIKYLKNFWLSDDIQMDLVKHNPDTIQFIDRNVNKEACKYAVSRNGWLIEHIGPSSIELDMLAAQQIVKTPLSPEQNRKLCAIIKHESVIQYAKNPDTYAAHIISILEPTKAHFLINTSHGTFSYSVHVYYHKKRPTLSIRESDSYTPIDVNLYAIPDCNNPDILDFIRKPSCETLIAAVKVYPSLIQYFKYTSREIQTAAIESDPSAIQHITFLEPGVLMAAVSSDISVIRYIQNPPLDVQMFVVRDNPHAIRYIENINEQAARVAVSVDASVIQYIQNPPLDTQLYVARTDPHAIRYIRKLDERALRVAVNIDGCAIKHIINPSTAVQMTALVNTLRALQYIARPNRYVLIRILCVHGAVIKYIQNPDIEMQLVAVQHTPDLIQYIDSPSLEVQIAAVSKDPDAIRKIKSPHKEVLRLIYGRSTCIRRRQTNTANIMVRKDTKHIPDAHKHPNDSAIAAETKSIQVAVPPAPRSRPDEHYCPISKEIMEDPVLTADGFTYERRSIEKWFKDHDISPMTGMRVKRDVVPNISLRKLIKDWDSTHIKSTYI